MSEDVGRIEYHAAQEMLRHYDSLNWQIGAVLIAATTILTGFALQKDSIDLLQNRDSLSLIIVVGVPLISWFVLSAWFYWFRRHRDLYNFRNETLQRLELRLGMYHYLRVVEAELKKNPATFKKVNKLSDAELDDRIRILENARANAYGDFKPSIQRFHCPIPPDTLW